VSVPGPVIVPVATCPLLLLLPRKVPLVPIAAMVEEVLVPAPRHLWCFDPQDGEWRGTTVSFTCALYIVPDVFVALVCLFVCLFVHAFFFTVYTFVSLCRLNVLFFVFVSIQVLVSRRSGKACLPRHGCRTSGHYSGNSEQGVLRRSSTVVASCHSWVALTGKCFCKCVCVSATIRCLVFMVCIKPVVTCIMLVPQNHAFVSGQ
jgi:hypothetical protein